MTILVNGEQRQVDEGTTVAQLLTLLGFGPVGVAVAIDRQVVPRGQHAERQLQEGADVEVIRAVGGG